MTQPTRFVWVDGKIDILSPGHDHDYADALLRLAPGGVHEGYVFGTIDQHGHESFQGGSGNFPDMDHILMMIRQLTHKGASIEDDLADVAERHIPSGGTYGDTYWDPSSKKVFWNAADWTTDEELDEAREAFLGVPGVEDFESDVESGPPKGDWHRVADFADDPQPTLYQCLWDDMKLRPEAKTKLEKYLLNALKEEFPNPNEWIHFTAFGSGASYNWDESGDFDVHIWVDSTKYSELHLEKPLTADELLLELRKIIVPINSVPLSKLGFPEHCKMLVQYYPLAGQGTKEECLATKPYALYDMETDTWWKKPSPLDPKFFGDWFLLLEPKARLIAQQASQLLDSFDLDAADAAFWDRLYQKYEDDRYQKRRDQSRANAEQTWDSIRILWHHLFAERQEAYSPEGEGINDERDQTNKLLELWGVGDRLKERAYTPVPWAPEAVVASLPEVSYELIERKSTGSSGNERMMEVFDDSHVRVGYLAYTLATNEDERINIEEDPRDWSYGPYFYSYEEGQPYIYVDMLRTVGSEGPREMGEISNADGRILMMLLGALRAKKLPVFADFENPKLKELAENKVKASKEGAWDDVQEKALRYYYTPGVVQLIKNGATHVIGKVKGDTAADNGQPDGYDTEFQRNDPNRNAITIWHCSCPWGGVSWGRTRQWKKYEGRICAHTQALFWASQHNPLDPDEAGGDQQVPIPGAETQRIPVEPTPLAPRQPGNAPQFEQLNMPGALAKVTRFSNGETVTLKQPLTGFDRNQRVYTVPVGTRGEVLTSDDAETIAIFPLQTGTLEPHLVKAQGPTEAFVRGRGSTPFVRRRRKSSLSGVEG